MKSPLLFLSTLLLLLGITANADPASQEEATETTTATNNVVRPYYLFRDAGCNDNDDPDGGDVGAGEIRSAEYGDGEDYSDYPTRQRRRRRAAAAIGDAKKAAVDENATTQPRRDLQSKCSKMLKPALEAGKKDQDKNPKEKTSKAGKVGKVSKASKASDDDNDTTPPATPTPPPTTTAPTPKYDPNPPAPIIPNPTKQPNSPPKENPCDAVSNGNVIKTSNSANLKYTYEAAISTDADDASSVVNEMETSLTKFVGKDLMDCDDRRVLLSETKKLNDMIQQKLQGRKLGGLDVVGIDANPQDKILLDESCTYFTGGNEIKDTVCYVVMGGMTLYLSEEESDEPWRKLAKVSSEVVTAPVVASSEELEAASVDALETIMGAMNDEDPSPFLDGSDEEYSVEGLVGVRFISGETHGKVPIVGDNEPDTPDGAEGAPIKSSKMTAVGTSMLTIGLLALIALVAIVAVKRRQESHATAYNEFKDDDENDLDGKTDTDDASTAPTLPSTPKQAYVVGEEGSIYTSATHDTRFLHTPRELGNGNDDDQKVDVHHCTSAMCPICNGKETVFVNAVDDQSHSPDTAGYEFSYENEEKRSFEYEPKEELSSPSFDNPSEIERPYVVDDTVAF